jgi:hypothetical protein
MAMFDEAKAEVMDVCNRLLPNNKPEHVTDWHYIVTEFGKLHTKPVYVAYAKACSVCAVSQRTKRQLACAIVSTFLAFNVDGSLMTKRS